MTSYSLQFEANEEDCCQKVLCCTCPHIAAHTVETFKKINFEVLEHPPYSPDLAATDTHLFGPLKQAMDQHLKATVHVWLVSQPQNFFMRAKRRLCSDGQSALKRKRSMLKNDVLVRYLLLF